MTILFFTDKSWFNWKITIRISSIGQECFGFESDDAENFSLVQ